MSSIAAVIVTRNRSRDLQKALTQLNRQTRTPDQVIVVDDCSADDTRAVASQHATTYVRLPKPQGYIYARNLACATADTDYVLSLDDDSWFTDADGLAQAEKILNENPSAGVVAFNILSPDGSMTCRQGDPIGPTRTFIGCGHLLRRSLFIDAGGYPDFFEGHGEEKAMSMSLLRGGYSVLAAPNIIVEHAFSPLERNWQRIRFREHRNDLLREIMFCPFSLLAPRLLLSWIRHSQYNFRNKYLTTDLKVLVDVPRLAGAAFRQRKPMSIRTYKAWHSIKT